ncbi:hypothetical protein [uncultured Xylophilus sp.]|uniref:hypothetical protein n=1 Tax=uncultured Xylophilus sp. TaxID=296832 RepID=UPI0025EC6268|nr:hypothetical protein [uncultured Xylophilus sp.]
MNSIATPPAVVEAQKAIGAVLAELEIKTGAEVRDIGLEAMVDTDASGRPVLQKAVEITLDRKPVKRWAT